MPDENVETSTMADQPDPTPDSGAVQRSATNSANPAALQSTGFRYQPGPGIPEWLVGKTAEEGAQIAASLYNSALGGQTRGQPQQQYSGYGQPQPNTYGGSAVQQPMQSSPSIQPPTQEDWDMNPQAAMQKQLEYHQQTNIVPQLQQYGNNLRSLAIANAKNQYKEEFDKYGPEIVNYMQQVDPQFLTPDMMDNIVKVVRGNHIDDIRREAMEKARKELEQQSASGMPLRSGTQPTGIPQPSTIDLESDELPREYRDLLKIKRISERELDEFLSGSAGSLYGTTMEQRRKGWFEAAKKGNVITEEMPRGA